MSRRILLLILVIIFGFTLRLWRVESIPPGVNRDEASIGYTAFSILKTGRDEYGISYPLSIKSFGDWKLPLYIYLDIIPVGLFSLNEFSVRLPSIFFGSLTIFITYLLIKELFYLSKNRDLLALLGAFSLSISPWHIHFSRVASEANISVFLVLLGLLFFLKGIRLRLLFLLFFSSVILSLSLYTYHGSHVFTVILFIALLFILILKRTRKLFVLSFSLPFVLLAVIIFEETILTADKTKFSGLSALSNKYLVYEKVDLTRLEHDYPEALSVKVLHNKLAFLVGSFWEGYIKGFSPEFLILHGGGNLQHNIPDFGNLYLVELPFMVLGIFILFHKGFQWRWLLLLWLLISPIPAAITRDAPHSARMLAILPLPHLLSAIGLIEIIHFISYKNLSKLFIISIAVLYGVNVSTYLDKYFVHFPIKSEFAWGGGYKELVSTINPLESKYKEILMDRPDYSPYIYFLFYNQTDPLTFQKWAVRYPDDSEGFQHVKSFKNLTFKKVDWSDDIAIPNRLIDNRLLVSWADSTPRGATASSLLVDKFILNKITEKFNQPFGLEPGDIVENRLIKTINLKNGKPLFYLIEINKIVKNELYHAE